MIKGHHRPERRTSRQERRSTIMARLAEAEETLRALRGGEIDALVVQSAAGDRVYTLYGAEEPYRNMVEQMREGAVMLSPSGDILYSNARFAELIGEPLESVVGRNIGRFMATADWDDFFTILMAGNGTRRSRFVSSGRPPVEVHLSLVTTISDGRRDLTLIATDLRELLEARGARERAESENRVKDEFLAMLGHELRNPLSAIRGAARVLEQAVPSGEVAARAQAVISRQTAHLSHMIEGLLDVQRVANNKMRVHRHPLDMRPAVERAVASFTGDATLDRVIDVTTETVWVDADADRLEQIIANILTNAVKYSPSRSRIAVVLRGDADDAVLTVTDAGFGMAAELLPTVFDMFVQGDHTLDRAGGGLGIGLALVHRLVELHGGTIRATSDGIGRGSTFTVRLPRVAANATSVTAASPSPSVTPRRILVIEDNRDARTMFRLMLEHEGHHVFEAANGIQGLQLLETERPEVAIIDIGLPGIDGCEVARRMRQSPNGHGLLMLALTGYGAAGDIQRTADAGFNHHLVKPIDPTELARIINEPVGRGVYHVSQ